ncbi:MAG: class I SAM-dependent methyltransferase [Chloroflexi bacterium]|nr:class I SAM-dependent methyltransferase [Chloroflexota bacterium]
MDERAAKIAAMANSVVYDSEATRDYIDGAPHVKHASLRALYGSLVVGIYDRSLKHTATSEVPQVLDLGAGEGSATLPFLELGARVTAVDVSESMLAALKEKCTAYAGMLEAECRDVFDMLHHMRDTGRKFDVVVANSFLHHVPDYLALTRDAVAVLSPHGQFFSFQEPLWHDSLGPFARRFSNVAYLAWRVFKADKLGGFKRRRRRSRGLYLEDCPEDNAEYHAVREGIDQNAMMDLFKESGLDYQMVRYFSTQSRLFQFIGSSLGMKNTFAIISGNTGKNGA